ncbi:MAG: DUF4174 domain-containing protein [Spirosomaceae bacterium]|nr:DUF4174 domain-containing protein [Spirosomataceae bacterium]
MIKTAVLLNLLTIILLSNAFGQNLQSYKWKNRVVLIFGNNATEQLVHKQWVTFDADKTGLEERGIQIFVNPESQSMKKLRNETGFEIILIGKDGGVKKRKTSLMQTDELFGIIDSMPMRQSEMRRKN